MEGAPGHQAGTLAPDGSQKRDERASPPVPRRLQPRGRTHVRRLRPDDGHRRRIVGFDARRRPPLLDRRDVGFARALRRRSAPGSDFWPGEYQKTYVHAQRSYQGVLDALRSGRIFAVAGDLITELDVEAKSGRRTAGIGETLSAEQGTTDHAHGRVPRSRRQERARRQPARLARRCHRRRRARRVGGRERRPQSDDARARAVLEKQWARDGDAYTITTTLPKTERDFYVRIRGTNTERMRNRRWTSSAKAPGRFGGFIRTRSLSK